MSLEWGAPLWLLALPLAGGLLVLRLRRKAAVVHPGAAAVAAGRLTAAVAILPDLLRALCLVVLAVALARPRSPIVEEADPAAGVPVVVAIDLSSSMLAEDWRCTGAGCAGIVGARNRFEVAQQTVARFVAGRSGDPTGLVGFAGEAATLVPITTYAPVLRQALSELRVGLLEDGTALGDGLAIAVNRLRRLDARSAAVILMTDGASNRGAVDPMVAARAAATFGIQVYTIGVGATEEALPAGAPSGTTADYDETLLRAIAETTGGEYFRAADPEALATVYTEVDRMLETPFVVPPTVRYREWFPILLLIGALALLLEWALRGSRWGVVPA